MFEMTSLYYDRLVLFLFPFSDSFVFLYSLMSFHRWNNVIGSTCNLYTFGSKDRLRRNNINYFINAEWSIQILVLLFFNSYVLLVRIMPVWVIELQYYIWRNQDDGPTKLQLVLIIIGTRIAYEPREFCIEFLQQISVFH